MAFPSFRQRNFSHTMWAWNVPEWSIGIKYSFGTLCKDKEAYFMLIIIWCCKILKRGTLWFVLVKNSLHFTPFLLISYILSIGKIGILPEARNQSPKGEIKTPTEKSSAHFHPCCKMANILRIHFVWPEADRKGRRIDASPNFCPRLIFPTTYKTARGNSVAWIFVFNWHRHRDGIIWLG